MMNDDDRKDEEVDDGNDKETAFMNLFLG